MAKSKKSKILAMALCASVMAGIYAAPVMAAEVDVTSGNLTGVTAQDHSDYSFTGGTLYLDDAGIAGALNGQNVNLGVITANSITSTAGITAAGGQFQVYGGSGGIAATSLSLLKDDNGIKSQNVLITNSGMARFGDSKSENVRIENGVLRVLDGNTELASLTSNGLTLNDGTVQGSLTATQLATINSAITTQNNKTVITGDELNIKGASGGLYVRDVVDGKSALAMLEFTNCDAIMVGRGAQGNPWVFKDIASRLSGGPGYAGPSVREKMELATRHAKMLSERDGRNIVRMRKHAMWYVAGTKDAAATRRKINDAVTFDDFALLFEQACFLTEQAQLN